MPAARPPALPCTGRGALFFSDRVGDLVYAQALCGTCDHTRTCYDRAVRNQEPYGMWGGHLFVGGRPVPLPKPQGRPPAGGWNAVTITARYTSEAVRLHGQPAETLLTRTWKLTA